MYECSGVEQKLHPQFVTLEQPIRSFVMNKLGSGRKTRRRADNIKLVKCPEWTPELKGVYVRLRLSLVQAIKRAYRDYNKVPYLFWDASKFAWSYTITQCDAADQ